MNLQLVKLLIIQLYIFSQEKRQNLSCTFTSELKGDVHKLRRTVRSGYFLALESKSCGVKCENSSGAGENWRGGRRGLAGELLAGRSSIPPLCIHAIIEQYEL